MQNDFQRILKAIILIFLFMLGPVRFTLASEEAAAPAEESTEAPAEGGEEGGAAPKRKKATKVSTALQTPEWIDLEFKISTLSVKIQTMQENLNNLILQKKALPEKSEKLKEIVEQITATDKEIRSAIEEHSKAAAKLKYRYPVRGEHNRKKYERIQQESVEQLEEALGVDGKLNLLLVKMRKQFGVVASEKSASNQSSSESTSRSPSSIDGRSTEEQSESDTMTIDKAKPVLLSK